MLFLLVLKVISIERQTFQQFEFPKLIRVIQKFSEVSKEMSLVDKCLESFFYAILLGSSFGQII
jgi:hypothetical protein